jgi:hypothetical protein
MERRRKMVWRVIILCVLMFGVLSMRCKESDSPMAPTAGKDTPVHFELGHFG